MITWILAGIAIVGAIFNANGKRIGFGIWLVSNSGWIIYCLAMKLYGQIPMWVIYNGLCIVGLIKWRQKGIK